MFCFHVLKRLAPCTGGQQSSICKFAPASSSVHFLQKSAPTIIWVSRSRGLPRSTCIISYTAPSLWHLQGISAISEDLGVLPAVSYC